MGSLSGSCVIRAALKLLMVLVFLGTIMLWIMMPTNTYRNTWMTILKAKFSTSTYFGAQGTTLLIYTFPFLLIAVLCCIYLHLDNKFTADEIKTDTHSRCSSSGGGGGGKKRLGVWKKPMVVKGPLGIVSGTELALLTMFVALLIWSLSTYLRNGFAKITPKSAAQKGEQVWEAKLGNAALRLGVVGNICLSFLFFPVARGSSVLPLLGITSEASIKYHIWTGHMVMALFTAHGLSYITLWAAIDHLSEMLKWAKTDISNLAGEISLVAGLLMWATTIPRIRRKFFELFFYTHYLYIVFVVFFVFHVGVSYACIMLPGFYIFMVDRYLRFLQSRLRVRLMSARLLPCETVELNFSKTPGLSYNPTSIMFINVPSISKLQWHPFTITSSSNLEPEKLSVMIKSEGSWSKKLYHMLSSSTASTDRLEVSVEGPYGPVSTNLLRHDTLVMVSGGSGITPFISIIRELIYESTTTKCKNQTPQVILISSFKNSNDLTMLDLLLPVTGTDSDLSKLNIQIEAFVTREKQPAAEEPNKLIRATWFKPKATDAPISSTLGPNSWLWLGAIISSSFAIFLVLIGVIDRFYIFPVDHNTNEVFSYTLRSLLDMLVICICIGTTSSAAFVWNKKRNAMEAKQIQNMEGITPGTSPNTLFYNADRELESLPHQSIVQATNIHYGGRPDLKRMLFDSKGSSVGVLVCGPKKMRHEVAAICSSGLADNLHFESISFSW